MNNRKRADLFRELQQKGFTPFPKNPISVEAVVAGEIETEESEESPEAVNLNGVRSSDYHYLLSMAIGTLTLEKVQELLADRDKLNKDVDDLRKATPESLWVKDLDALEMQLDVWIQHLTISITLFLSPCFSCLIILCMIQELDKSDARAEEERKKLKCKVKSDAGPKIVKRAPKNPRKNEKKADNAKAVAEIMGETGGFKIFPSFLFTDI